MFNSKHIKEMLKDISYIGVSKPDTPDIDRIEEVNNPEGKVFATSIKVEMTPFTPFQPRLHNKLDETSKLAWGLVGDKVELIEFKD